MIEFTGEWWPLLCLAGVVSTLLGVAGLLAPGAAVVRFRTVVGLGIAACLAGGVVAARPGWAAAWPVVVLAGASAALALLGSPWAGRFVAAARGVLGSARLHAAFLVAVGPSLLLWAGLQADTVAAPDVTLTLDVASASRMEEVQGVHAVTDRGNPVRVFTRETPESPLTLGEDALLAEQGLTYRAIRTGPADPTYNCHGWVFTGGRFCVSGSDVDVILHDNGYRTVNKPRADDLAVYRDEAGAVVHSGLVRSTSADGLTLIESKWGCMGRYVHVPQDQLYGPSVSYHRSLRPGHLLRGLGGETPAAVPAAGN
jgi:hypothetical protein